VPIPPPIAPLGDRPPLYPAVERTASGSFPPSVAGAGAGAAGGAAEKK
jgi:hypothetical protein